MYTWAMDVATLFLTLVFVMISAWEGFSNKERARLSNWQEWEDRLSLLHLLKEWKEKWLEKWLEKESIILHPGANSGLRGSKEEKTSLNLLSISTTRPLINSHWCFVRKSSNRQWGVLRIFGLDSNKEWRMWLFERAWALSCNLLLCFWRWRWIGIRPAIALIPKDGDVLNAPSIQKAALLYIFLKTFRGYNTGALL